MTDKRERKLMLALSHDDEVIAAALEIALFWYLKEHPDAVITRNVLSALFQGVANEQDDLGRTALNKQGILDEVTGKVEEVRGRVKSNKLR